MLPVKCIFSCNNNKCSKNDLSNSATFKSIICPFHLKHVFGLKQSIYKQESEIDTELVGPYLILDDDFSFEENTVVFPTKEFLDSVLFPEYHSNMNENNMYHLNPRMQHYYDRLLMEYVNKEEGQYHFELIRNLDVKNVVKNIDMSQKQNLANTNLVTNLQNRLSNLNHWIRNEPFYKVFKSIEVYPLDGEETLTLEEGFSPFYSFLLFNCVMQSSWLPQPTTPISDSAPLNCYPNLAYKTGIGFVTMSKIKNPSWLTVMGGVKGNNAYYSFKTRRHPKATVGRRYQTTDMPDNLRNLNVISNSNFCN